MVGSLTSVILRVKLLVHTTEGNDAGICPLDRHCQPSEDGVVEQAVDPQYSERPYSARLERGSPPCVEDLRNAVPLFERQRVVFVLLDLNHNGLMNGL